MKVKFFILVLLVFFAAFSGTAKPKGYLPPSPLWKKLYSIKIDKIDFEDAKPLAVFKYLRIRSKDLDPAGKGVNFVFKGLKGHKSLVTVKLENLPLADAIKYVCLTGDLIYKVDDHAVVIMPKPPKAKKEK